MSWNTTVFHPSSSCSETFLAGYGSVEHLSVFCFFLLYFGLVSWFQVLPFYACCEHRWRNAWFVLHWDVISVSLCVHMCTSLCSLWVQWTVGSLDLKTKVEIGQQSTCRWARDKCRVINNVFITPCDICGVSRVLWGSSRGWFQPRTSASFNVHKIQF